MRDLDALRQFGTIIDFTSKDGTTKQRNAMLFLRIADEYEALEKTAADLLDVADSIAQRGIDKDRNLEQLAIASDALRKALDAVKHE